MRSASPLGAGGSSMESPIFFDALFNKFLLSNNEDEEAWPVVDMYGGRIYDWTECPFAHLGEKARHCELDV
uniref:AtC3H23-like CCCH zinc finger domain-containing protein n=1 Tax=Physcomitrium patens TaxID=3218 RepID=A0A2K1IWQ7_PHYPA|nr:hypothetical protein PHYPA_023533 [Physcomitrium patens]